MTNEVIAEDARVYWINTQKYGPFYLSDMYRTPIFYIDRTRSKPRFNPSTIGSIDVNIECQNPLFMNHFQYQYKTINNLLVDIFILRLKYVTESDPKRIKGDMYVCSNGKQHEIGLYTNVNNCGCRTLIPILDITKIIIQNENNPNFIVIKLSQTISI